MSDMEKKISISEEELKKIAAGEGDNSPRLSDVPCPLCWEIIPRAIDAVRSGNPIVCPHCKKQMNVASLGEYIPEHSRLWEEWERRQKAK